MQAHQGITCYLFPNTHGRTMKNNPFAVAQKYLDNPNPQTQALEVVETNQSIQAVKICSHVLEDEIWLILDRSFIPHDGLAWYYAEEIPLLRTKTSEDLKEIHRTKLAFQGAKVIQEGPDSAPAKEPKQGDLKLRTG